MEIPLPLQIVLQILLQIVLIALNAIFACAEIAVIETKGTRLDKLSEEGNRQARRLKRLADTPARFLATIQVAITLSGFLASAFAAENFSIYIVDWLGEGANALHLASDATINAVSVILITVVLSYFTLVFGELVPKRLAMKKPEKIALAMSGIINFIAVVFKPLVWLLTISTNGVLRMFKINPHEDDEKVSEEDIRMLADAGSEKGSIDAEENEMIQNVFEFDDITVGEIATHRTEMKVLWEEDSDEDWESFVKNDTHAFYPICGEDIDHIVGVLDSKAYLRLSVLERKNVLENAVVHPHFVAQVMKADVLFREMKRERFRIAIVVDEYGGTYGIVTLNDLIEQIVGDLDETENEGDIVKEGEGYIISGLAERESVDDIFDIDTEADSATIGGWVMEHLEKIPEAGDEIEADGIRVKVTKADDKRVIEVYAEKLPETEEDDEAAAK